MILTASIVDNVRAWLGNDVQRHDQCGVDDLLQYFLVRCHPNHDRSEAAKLLQDSITTTRCVLDDTDLRENLTQ